MLVKGEVWRLKIEPCWEQEESGCFVACTVHASSGSDLLFNCNPEVLLQCSSCFPHRSNEPKPHRGSEHDAG